MIKVIASDMDGTLLGLDHKVAPRTLEAIHMAQEQGIRFMIATGRNFRSAMEELEEMVVPAPLERRTIRMAEQRPEETEETAVTPTMEEATETAAPVVKVLRERSMEEIRMVITARMVKSSS